jgi:DNA-binding NtrC family response regulator
MLETQRVRFGIRALFLTSRGCAARGIVSSLEGYGLRVTERPVDGGAYRFASGTRPDLILIEHTEPCERSWQELASQIQRAFPAVPIILLTASGSEGLAIAALRLGVRDYLSLPLCEAALEQALDRCLQKLPGNDSFSGRPGSSTTDPMVGSSTAICDIRSYMTRAAASDCTVLITGETGTGKELAAEYIHNHSRRRDKPFVCVNCAAIPDTLIESELFGHVRGAFTGADNLRDGLLASADGGTVLLDEIGDMSLSAQAKILRVLEKKEVSRLGATQRQKIDVRFLAATNQDLEMMASRGSFRSDLFYRLNVARVELPPLRERREDIPLLVDHYRSKIGGDAAASFSDECLRRLLQYDWPGNIRELKNVLESIFFADTPCCIGSEHLPQRLRERIERNSDLPPGERDRLVAALCSAQWNKSRAAEKLQWSRMTLYRKMEKYRVSRFSSSVIPPNAGM